MSYLGEEITDIVHPEEGIESQAIDRCNRIGQTKPVHVYQLVAEKTVEAKVGFSRCNIHRWTET